MKRRDWVLYGGCFAITVISGAAGYLYCSLSGDTRVWSSAGVMLIVLVLIGAPLMRWSSRAFPEWELPPGSSVEKRTKIVHGVAFFVTFAACIAVAYALFTYTRRMELSFGLLLLLVTPITAAFAWWGYVNRPVSALETSALKKTVVLFAILPFLMITNALLQYNVKPRDMIDPTFHAFVELLLFSVTVLLAVQWPFMFVRYRRARAL